MAHPEWLDIAINELAEDEDLDVDTASVRNLGFRANAYEVSFGGTYGPEYIVAEDDDEAEALAIEIVKQDLDDEPGVFNQDFLARHLTITDTDIRVYAGDDANFIYEMDDDEAIERANMEDQLEKYQDAIDAAEEARDDYGDIAIEDGYDDDEYDRLDGLVDAAEEAYEEAKSRIADEAREKAAEDHIEYLEEELKRDPIGYFRDNYGYDMSEIMNMSIFYIDIDAAAEDAVNTDGVEHFLARYDGNQIDLDSGAVAFRTN